MKKRILSMLLALAMSGSLLVPAFAADSGVPVDVTLDGELTGLTALVFGGTSYLEFEEGVRLFCPEAQVTQEGGLCTAEGEGFVLTARAGDPYLSVNGRYLYTADPVKWGEEDQVLVPCRVLCVTLGATVGWSGKVDFTSGEAPMSGELPYSEEELDLVSRVIMHESGYESLLGKIAVGSVILNRVKSGQFPNTVSGVIFQKNQFPGATNVKSVNEESLLAAKLALEGANVVPGAYFFNGVGLSCWASRNKTLLYTIGGHAFYG